MRDDKTEEEARRDVADETPFDALPPGPIYGPFGYFRLGILVLAGIVVVLLVLKLI